MGASRMSTFPRTGTAKPEALVLLPLKTIVMLRMPSRQWTTASWMAEESASTLPALVALRAAAEEEEEEATAVGAVEEVVMRLAETTSEVTAVVVTVVASSTLEEDALVLALALAEDLALTPAKYAQSDICQSVSPRHNK